MENQKEKTLETQKTLEEKTILERHTLNGQFNLGTALLDMDNKLKVLYEVTHNQSVALEFLTAWFEQNGKTSIQVDIPKIELLS
jgi:hypothetical protein